MVYVQTRHIVTNQDVIERRIQFEIKWFGLLLAFSGYLWHTVC